MQTIQDRRHLRRAPLPKTTSSATDCVRNDRYAHGFCSTLRRNALRIVRTAAVFRDRQLSMYLPKSAMLSLALLRVLDLLRALIYRFEHPRHISYVTYTLGQSNTWLVVYTLYQSLSPVGAFFNVNGQSRLPSVFPSVQRVFDSLSRPSSSPFNQFLGQHHLNITRRTAKEDQVTYVNRIISRDEWDRTSWTSRPFTWVIQWTHAEPAPIVYSFQGKHSAPVPLGSRRIQGQQASLRKSDRIIRL